MEHPAKVALLFKNAWQVEFWLRSIFSSCQYTDKQKRLVNRATYELGIKRQYATMSGLHHAAGKWQTTVRDVAQALFEPEANHEAAFNQYVGALDLIVKSTPGFHEAVAAVDIQMNHELGSPGIDIVTSLRTRLDYQLLFDGSKTTLVKDLGISEESELLPSGSATRTSFPDDFDRLLIESGELHWCLHRCISAAAGTYGRLETLAFPSNAASLKFAELLDVGSQLFGFMILQGTSVDVVDRTAGVVYALLRNLSQELEGVVDTATFPLAARVQIEQLSALRKASSTDLRVLAIADPPEFRPGVT